MFRHYLITALRNFRKYALQNTVSIIGLAAGFICLSLSTLWIHFEESFDTFHKDADRLYFLSRYDNSRGEEENSGRIAYYELPVIISFPEIESWTKFCPVRDDSINHLLVDSTFFRFFDLDIAKGDNRFMTDSNYVAISKEYARRMFHGEDPIGMQCDGKTIGAVIAPFPGPSSIEFDVLSWHDFPLLPREINYNDYSSEDQFNNVVFKVAKDVDIKQLSDTISKAIHGQYLYSAYTNALKPFSELHKLSIRNDTYINYIHSRLFATASLLLLVCAVINFMLFSLNRIRNRQREMALRMVHGASGMSVSAMMAVEYALVLAPPLLLGLIMVLILKEPFRNMTDASMTGGYITGGSMLIMLLVFALSMAACVTAAAIVRHRTMQSTINRTGSRTFRSISIGIQVFTSILFIFSVCAMLYQFRFLRNNDWGVRINNTAVLTIPNPSDRYGNRYDQPSRWYPPTDEDAPVRRGRSRFSPELVTDFMARVDSRYGLTEKLMNIPSAGKVYFGYGDIMNIYETAEKLYTRDEFWINGRTDIIVWALDVLGGDVFDLLSLHVIDGEIPSDRPIGKDEIVITQNLQRELGLGSVADEPTITVERSYTNPATGYFDETGFHITSGGEEGTYPYTFRVIAVVSDIYTFTYDMEPGKYILCTPGNRRLMPSPAMGWSQAMFTFTFEEGMKNELRTQIDRIMADTDYEYELTFTEDAFYANLESEKHLTRLIELLGLVCLLISISGIFSIITLSCQERKREIALRKVHGARVKDILAIFGREYGILFLIASASAFITGYFVIHHWMQQFQRQATIGWWIYASIFAVMALVICLTVGDRVLTTARENPADVIKSE